MSKGILVLGAVVIALALFWKPITDMLNGIVGGGSETDKYFAPRDTSTSQGPAYDPPNPDAPVKTVTTYYAEPEPDKQPDKTSDGTSTTDYRGDGEKAPTQEAGTLTDAAKGPIDAANLIQAGSEGALWGAGAIAAEKVIKTTPNAWNKLKDVAKKGAEVAEKIIKSPAAKRLSVRGAIVTAGMLAAADKGLFGIGDTLNNYIEKPLENAIKPLPEDNWFTRNLNPGKGVKTSTPSKTAYTPTKLYDQPAGPANPSGSAGITATNKMLTGSTVRGGQSYYGVRFQAKGGATLSPKIAAAIAAAQGGKK